MTKLDCNVTSCVHNADNCCCKQEIIVEGSSANKRCDTCCGSFDESRDGSFKNMFKSPESRLEIECEAVNCVYNASRRCTADRVGITGLGASKAGDTECSTFKAR
ncbi:DUF1540 domain-containing protein [Lachnoclostridium sp. An14]|uniref:DUF1540 domain-containing protein n=1 Tax=Lachnoclostridium sp. An14 TaxID=1965562 RepID=UPI000B3A2679|nr:DUF1540 domain-containing protein [Lachnoclostridium sp. An14]OUQ17862.1 DUF1540 domain-containing protein [Lachnoclostridium sp. An14]